MIQALKFKFKSKGPASGKNRMVNLCIDSTTGILIVAMFFFARHLRQMMPGPPLEPIRFSALADAVNSKASTAATALTGALAKKIPAPVENSPATGQSAPAVAVAPATNSIAAFPPVEISGPSNAPADNLAGWITPKADNKSTATSPAAALGNSTLTAAASPAKANTQPAESQSTPTASATSQTASAKPAPASQADAWMSVFSRGQILPSEKPAGKSLGQPATASAARQSQTADSTVSAPLTEEQKRLAAAQAGFGYVLNLASKNPDIYGFTPSDPIQECKLGEPIRVYTVSAVDQKSYQPGQPLKNILKPTNKWVYPALLGSQVRFMVPVEEADGECVAGTSSRSLGMVYGKILNRWPTSQGFHPQLIINGSMDNYYFSIPELPEQNLTDTSEMFEFNPTLSPASVILASWQ